MQILFCFYSFFFTLWRSLWYAENENLGPFRVRENRDALAGAALCLGRCTTGLWPPVRPPLAQPPGDRLTPLPAGAALGPPRQPPNRLCLIGQPRMPQCFKKGSVRCLKKALVGALKADVQLKGFGQIHPWLGVATQTLILKRENMPRR